MNIGYTNGANDGSPTRMKMDSKIPTKRAKNIVENRLRDSKIPSKLLA